MQLIWLDVADLIAKAGGDPWAINQSLQAASASQIESLAEAFNGAGRHSAEADTLSSKPASVSTRPGTTRTATTRSMTPPKCSV